MTGLFGGEGFIMQKLEGDGLVFIHVGGTVIERELAEGEELHVDTGCVVAMTPGIEFDIVRAGSVKSMIFGGQGVFFAQLRGPGTVWLQSPAVLAPRGSHHRQHAIGGIERQFRLQFRLRRFRQRRQRR